MEHTQNTTINKKRREFGNPVEDVKPNQRFIQIPDKFNKPQQLLMSLDKVLSNEKIDNITKSGKIVFHTVGDTGGIHGTDIQEALSHLMEKQVHTAVSGDKPSFFYHLGDIVYYNGLSHHYEEQFYDPYKYYPAKIFAIPGNHDCDIKVRAGNEPDAEVSLQGFMDNFCNKEPSYSPYSSYRKTVNQPWPYWVLDAPFVKIIGLFSNVDGSFDEEGTNEQYRWYSEQLKNAEKDKCLIVTMHHPPFSLDSSHGGYPLILDVIDKAAKNAGRYPDMILSGHVHNYQRFTRQLSDKKIPHIIAGAGGYANTSRSMHRMQKNEVNDYISVPFKTTHKGLVLNYYNQTNPGFLKFTVDAQFIYGEYHVINFESIEPPTVPDDEFKFDWKNNIPIAIE